VAATALACAWQAGSVFGVNGHVIAGQPPLHTALGGGGIASLLIHLFIWHEIFRLFRHLWRIHTFGPFIVVLLGLIVVGFIVWRQSGRSTRWSRRRGGGSTGYGNGKGPRDW
jgi:hypothetical protein